jgi:hypothetical protein
MGAPPQSSTGAGMGGFPVGGGATTGTQYGAGFTPGAPPAAQPPQGDIMSWATQQGQQQQTGQPAQISPGQGGAQWAGDASRGIPPRPGLPATVTSADQLDQARAQQAQWDMQYGGATLAQVMPGGLPAFGGGMPGQGAPPPAQTSLQGGAGLPWNPGFTGMGMTNQGGSAPGATTSTGAGGMTPPSWGASAPQPSWGGAWGGGGQPRQGGGGMGMPGMGGK